MTTTDKLLDDLKDDLSPVSPLPSPAWRTMTWMLLSLPYMAVIVLLFGLSPTLGAQLSDTNFLIEQCATLLAAISAAYAAFWMTIPGRTRRVVLLPILPLSVWILTLGYECFVQWQNFGAEAWVFKAHWMCIPSIAAVGVLPAALMGIMIVRGAPLYPHIAVALGGLASAALGNFGLNLFHEPDAGLMVLLWHFGTVVFVSVLAAFAGPVFLHWRTA